MDETRVNCEDADVRKPLTGDEGSKQNSHFNKTAENEHRHVTEDECSKLNDNFVKPVENGHLTQDESSKLNGHFVKPVENGHITEDESSKLNVDVVTTSEIEHGLVLHKVDDPTSPHLAFIFGLQQVLLSISSTITVPLIVAGEICAGELDLAKSQILSTFLFMCGICTILQTSLGVRQMEVNIPSRRNDNSVLPELRKDRIIQGGCHKFIPAIVALMSLPAWKCPDMTTSSVGLNETDSLANGAADELWMTRMREIQGGIMTSSIIQILIGCTGILGVILHYVGPITILPTITLVGLSLIDVALRFCEKHWGIAALTIALVLVFSLYLSEVRIPLPAFNKLRKCHITRYPVFKLLPVILAVAISWSVCAILTVAGRLSDDPKSKEYFTRTDARSGAIKSASWFFFPYPGQWGTPTVSVSSFMAMLTATIASVVESVGDYYACARISGELPPPVHAVNRGIAIEGIGGVISGAIGSGGATTSYSQNVGAIGFTKVASRRAFNAAGIIFIVCGVCGKFGALLTLIPDPVLGGILLVSFGMVTSVGLSNLQFVSLHSTRNLVIVGCSILIGLMIPRYLAKNPGSIQTGNEELDQVLAVLLSTSMFVGGLIGFVLDNTVPGTMKERGIKAWRKDLTTEDGLIGNASTKTSKIYDLPLVTDWLKKQSFAAYIPFLPTFQTSKCRISFKCCRKSRDV